jgi:imidazolonepropionase
MRVRKTRRRPVLSSAVDTDCEGRLITPGLIDCHTHLVYAGTRSGEFEQRLNGVSYEAIAKQGWRNPLDGERHARRD